MMNTELLVKIVLLHGWGMNSGIFDIFASQLRATLRQGLTNRFTLHCLDLPGFGHAIEDAEYADSLQTMSDRVFQQILSLSEQHVKDLPVVLIGWSLGGLVAQKLAIDAANHGKPINVAALITLCSTPKFMQSDAGQNSWPGIKQEVLEAFQAQLNEDSVKVLKRFLAIQNMGQPSAHTNVQAMLEALGKKPLASPETLASTLAILKNSDLRAALHHIECPQLRVYGRLDSLVPYQTLDAVSNLLAARLDGRAGSQIYKAKVYEKASHAPFLSHPEALTRDITEFLEKNLKF